MQKAAHEIRYSCSLDSSDNSGLEEMIDNFEHVNMLSYPIHERLDRQESTGEH